MYCRLICYFILIDLYGQSAHYDDAEKLTELKLQYQTISMKVFIGHMKLKADILRLLDSTSSILTPTLLFISRHFKHTKVLLH